MILMIFLVVFGIVMVVASLLGLAALVGGRGDERLAGFLCCIFSGFFAWAALGPGLTYTPILTYGVAYYAPNEIVRSKMNDSTMITYTEFSEPKIMGIEYEGWASFDKSKNITFTAVGNDGWSKLYYGCDDSNLVVRIEVGLNVWGKPLVADTSVMYRSDRELSKIKVVSVTDWDAKNEFIVTKAE